MIYFWSQYVRLMKAKGLRRGRILNPRLAEWQSPRFLRLSTFCACAHAHVHLVA